MPTNGLGFIMIFIGVVGIIFSLLGYGVVQDVSQINKFWVKKNVSFLKKDESNKFSRFILLLFSSGFVWGGLMSTDYFNLLLCSFISC